MNGINQMYGRKIVMITNNYEKLKDIHNGALIRPGRVDKTIEFKKCNIKDMKQLIQNFFPNDIWKNKYDSSLEDYKYTAAELANMCKRSESIKNVIFSL